MVSFRPEGSALYFTGIVQCINSDGTLDILCEGDDPEDIEKSISRENVRKLMSTRSMAYKRWKKALYAVIASNKFNSSLTSSSSKSNELVEAV